MLFTSPSFLVLVALTFGLYYLPGLASAQVAVLVLASLVFYGWEDPNLLWLLLGSVAFNTWASGRLLREASASRRRHVAAAGVAVNLALLGAFKYATLLGSTLERFLGEGQFARALMHVPLPIGISFYTFHSISLLVDVLRARERGAPVPVPDVPAARHGLNTLLYICFFPQLVAGPIVKAAAFFPQIGAKRFVEIPWEHVFRRLVLGYFLKMVVADNLQELTSTIQHPAFLGSGGKDLAALLFAYSIQIFSDFAGYSLIAMGLAALFGYRFPVNFNFPYKADSIADFWRRWHISLSSWLRDYLYIPLGGNRHGAWRTGLNLLIVMFLGGLWHGAAWSYAVWGVWHGGALMLERGLGARTTGKSGGLARRLRQAFVFVFVSLSWLLFKLPEFGDAVDYARTMVLRWNQPASRLLVASILLYSTPVVLYHLADGRWGSQAWLRRLQPLAYGLMLLLLLVNPGSSEAFIYFQF